MTYPPHTPPPQPAYPAARSRGSPGQRQPLDTARRRGHGSNGPPPRWLLAGLRHGRAALNRKTAETQLRGGAVTRIGELRVVGTAPAIANAVFHAAGRRIRHLPAMPEDLL
jgi:hypothetical protein